VVLRLSRELRREGGESGLTPLDSMLLGSIRHNRGIGVSELADLERMQVPTMSAHVKRLEAAGFVERDDDAHTDKRRTSLKLTKAGEKALDALRKKRNDWLAARLATLSEGERLALASAITPLSQLAGDTK
jgi:DNA-binding MarR family transcriptional regulator